MENSKMSFSIDVPAKWTDVFVRTVLTGLVAFVVLQSKEWFDAGMLDTPATATDSGLIAAGVFVLNAMLKLLKF